MMRPVLTSVPEKGGPTEAAGIMSEQKSESSVLGGPPETDLRQDLSGSR